MKSRNETEKKHVDAEGAAGDSGAEAARIEHDIERTRAKMTETLGAIEAQLDPAKLREKAVVEFHHVEEKVKEAVKEQFAEAKIAVRGELLEAKETVKQEIQEAFGHAKQALHDATIGKVENMAQRASNSVVETRDSMMDTVRQNPVPAALVGVGLVWLFMNRTSRGEQRARGAGLPASDRYPRSGPFVDQYGRAYARDLGYDYDYGGYGRLSGRHEEGPFQRVQQGAQSALHQVQEGVSGLAQKATALGHQATDATGDLVHQASDAAGQLVHQASDAAGQLAHRATDTAGQLAHRASDAANHFADDARDAAMHAAYGARDQARRVEKGFEETLHSNPLAVGAAVMALGALVGMALPRTEREDQIMGEARDHLLEQAEGVAHEALDTAQHAAQHGMDQVKSALDEAAAG